MAEALADLRVGVVGGRTSARSLAPRKLVTGLTDNNHFAAVNGDGLADIVRWASDGVYVSLATGDGASAAPTSALGYFGADTGWTSHNLLPHQVSDVNGDAPADIANASAGLEVASAQDTQQVPLVSGQDAHLWGSNDDFIIGRRMQDHLLVRSNRNNYIMVNRGDATGLQFCKTSGDAIWRPLIALPNTDQNSTSDIRWGGDGQSLLVTYSNELNQVVYSRYYYDATLASWNLGTSSVVGQFDAGRVVNPTLTVSTTGRTLVSYTQKSLDGLQFHLRILPPNGTQWAAYDATLSGVSQGSARAIATNEIAGVIYTTDTSLIWLSPDGSGGLTQQQVMPVAVIGEFASHFDATTFNDDIYVAMANKSGELLFTSRDGLTNAWWPGPIKVSPEYVTNVQLSISDTGNLYLTYDDAVHHTLQVAISRDSGFTWSPAANLTFPAVADPVTRFEAPSHFTSDLLVMLQINSPSDPHVEGLLQYTLHVDPATGDITSQGGATFVGTDAEETIAPGFVSPTVTADRPGSVMGTGGDTLQGLGGNEPLQGGAGTDTQQMFASTTVEDSANRLYVLVGLGNEYAVGGELNDIIATGAGSDFIFGTVGDDTIDAGTGADFIYGNAGNDFIYTDDLITLSQDFIYVSGSPGSGTGVDTVADFTPGAGGDVAVVMHTPGVTTFADIQSHMLDVGGYTAINLSATDQLLLYNVDPGQLTANNFLFI